MYRVGRVYRVGRQNCTRRPRATEASHGPARASHPLPGCHGPRGTWRESACVGWGPFVWPRLIFRISHTNGRGGNDPPARDPPGARANSHRCRWVYEGGRKKKKWAANTVGCSAKLQRCDRCNAPSDAPCSARLRAL